MPGRPNDQGRRVALVTGATGIVGRHLVMLLGESNDWEVLAATRKGELNYVEPKDFGERVKAIKVRHGLSFHAHSMRKQIYGRPTDMAFVLHKFSEAQPCHLY